MNGRRRPHRVWARSEMPPTIGCHTIATTVPNDLRKLAAVPSFSRPTSWMIMSGRFSAVRPPWSVGLVGGQRFLDRAVFSVAQRALALQDRVHLAGALVDDRRAGVAQEALHGVLGRVAVRAVHLDRIVRGVESGVGRVLLGHRHLARVARAGVLHPPDLEIEQAADLVVARHARDHLLHELVAAYLLAECLALARVFDRRFESFTHGAGRPGGDREAAVVEAAHGDLETVALVADAVRFGHFHVAHENRADIAGANAEAVLDRFGAQRLAARLPVE